MEEIDQIKTMEVPPQPKADCFLSFIPARLAQSKSNGELAEIEEATIDPENPVDPV